MVVADSRELRGERELPAPRHARNSKLRDTAADHHARKSGLPRSDITHASCVIPRPIITKRRLHFAQPGAAQLRRRPPRVIGNGHWLHPRLRGGICGLPHTNERATRFHA